MEGLSVCCWAGLSFQVACPQFLTPHQGQSPLVATVRVFRQSPSVQNLGTAPAPRPQHAPAACPQHSLLLAFLVSPVLGPPATREQEIHKCKGLLCLSLSLVVETKITL